MTCLLAGLTLTFFSWNAVRPVRGLLLGPSFAAATFAAELGLVLALVSLASGAAFYTYGAAQSAPGLAGLALHGLAFAGAALLEVRALSAVGIATTTLRELGPLTVPARLSWRARPVALWHGGVERIDDLQYGPAGARNRVDLYRPRGVTAPRPVLLQLHGGAWVFGSKRVQARPLMLHLAAAGWVCAPITYRLAPRAQWPAQLDDSRLALRWLIEHVAEYGGDPTRIVVTGGSAGGHLAAMLALTESQHVAGCAPFYAPTDLATLFGAFGRDPAASWICRSTFGCATDARDALDAASPLHHVHANAPPFFVVHGTADNLVPVEQARSFVKALSAVSTSPVLYAELPGAVHAFDVFRGPRTMATVAAVHRFAEWAASRPRPSPVTHQADRPA
ncbi:MAG: alpha/beta hydrolase [Myxococcaceae bacterium]|nr:alpha/beta hydrolase [Myxococcaceae bacterium]